MSEDDFDQADDGESAELWHVYFLTLIDPSAPNRDFGKVKVGITKGAVERRIEHLQTGNPYRIRCEASFQSPVARAVECWVHRTNQVEYLEWLRLSRTEIPALVEEAKRESERLTRIAEAMERWSQVESNGQERSPSASERRIHDNTRGVLEDLLPTLFQLDLTLSRMALAAGNVRRVPGIIEMRRYEPFKRFKVKLAHEKFPHLVAAHTTDKVRPHFRPKGMPGSGAPQWASVRAEAESLNVTRRALDTAMLLDIDTVKGEGKRTDQLVELHEQFLALLHKKTRLEVDRKDLKAQAIQATENWEVISGLWSYRRTLHPKFDGKAFREAHRTEAAASSVASIPFIQRKVFLSRSY